MRAVIGMTGGIIREPRAVYGLKRVWYYIQLDRRNYVCSVWNILCLCPRL
jgi:hypothetical protein